MLSPLLGQCFLLQQLAVTEDGGQRRAQIVRDIGNQLDLKALTRDGSLNCLVALLAKLVQPRLCFGKDTVPDRNLLSSIKYSDLFRQVLDATRRFSKAECGEQRDHRKSGTEKREVRADRTQYKAHSRA